jgi:hypothetical protein
MASRSLLKRLTFRDFIVPASLDFKAVNVRIGDPKSSTGVRKFAREYLPVLAYKFQDLKVTQSRLPDEQPSSVTLTLIDGSTRAVSLENRDQRAIYCDVTGLDASALPSEGVPRVVQRVKRAPRKASAAVEQVATPTPTEE